jgi:hypothetical protein
MTNKVNKILFNFFVGFYQLLTVIAVETRNPIKPQIITQNNPHSSPCKKWGSFSTGHVPPSGLNVDEY